MQLRPAHRRLLASLLLDPDSWVTTDTLVDRMWGESPPSSARSSLHVHLSAVRRQIPGVITSGSSAYSLDLSGHIFDVPVFSSLVAEAAGNLERGHLRTASELATRAMGMWRGTPFEELDEVSAARAERARLAEVSNTARATLARALMLQGRVSESIGHLRGILEIEPFNEPMWEELIHAYYLAGRQVDALAAFNQAKQALGDELGLEPGPRLRQLEEQVLLHDPELLAGSSLAEPRAGFAKSPTNLPGFTTPFIGRVKSINRLSQAVMEKRLITVVGIGGLGKTRMAVEAARRIAAGFEAGAAFTTLEFVEDPDLVLQPIAGAVADKVVSTIDSLAAVIGDRKLLLVLDNCEHLTEAVGNVVVHLLRSCPSLTILATSRTPLGVAGEAIWSLGPLDLPAEDAPLSRLRRFESVMFFVEAARRVHPDFKLNEVNAPSVARICRELAGIPLALELAASHCDILTPGDLEQLLANADETMSRPDLGRPLRHHSLDDTVAWSLGLLEPGDRRVFERMAVFAGPVDRSAIETVCGDGGDGHLTDSLRRLSHSSLITVDVDGDVARYGQLPPIKQAAKRRVPTVEWNELRQAHARHFTELAKSTTRYARTPEERAWFHRVGNVIEEIRAAFEVAREVDPALGLQAAVTLLPFWHSRNRIVEGRYHIASLRAVAIETAEDGDLAASLKAEGTLAFAMSDLNSAESLLNEALESFSRLGDRAQMAAVLNNLGVVAVDSGDLEAALDRYTRARGLFEEEQDPHGRAASSLNIGVVELQRERSGSARSWFQLALDEFRRVENRPEEAHAMERLAHVANFEGDIEEARTWLQGSRRISLEMGMVDAVARADWLLAMVALDADEVGVASALAARASRAAQSLNHHAWWTPGLLETSAQIAATAGDLGLAAALVGAAASFRRVTGTSRPAFSNAQHEAFVDSLRRELGAGFSAHLARGESTSVREALTLIPQELEAAREQRPDSTS